MLLAFKKDPPRSGKSKDSSFFLKKKKQKDFYLFAGINIFFGGHMKNWQVWVRQPTTVAGISAALGTLVGLALQQLSWGQAIPLLAGAVMSIVLPDNTAAKAQAEALASSLAEKVITTGDKA